MIIHGDVAFMILATTLVLIMTPGLAFFYGGLVERKKCLNYNVPSIYSNWSCFLVMDFWRI